MGTRLPRPRDEREEFGFGLGGLVVSLEEAYLGSLTALIPSIFLFQVQTSMFLSPMALSVLFSCKASG